jgi:hypothetical protein
MGQPYPPVTAKPNGATAIITAVLAMLMGLWFLLGVFRLGFDTWLPAILSQAANLILGVLLLLGGILLLARKRAGRVLCVAGSIAALLVLGMALLVLLVPTGMFFFPGGPAILPFLPWRVEQATELVPPAATLLFALVPATGSWTRHVMNFPVTSYPPGQYPPGQYPHTPRPQQQYPPPQYPQQPPYPPQPPQYPPYQQGQHGGRPPGW